MRLEDKEHQSFLNNLSEIMNRHSKISHFSKYTAKEFTSKQQKEKNAKKVLEELDFEDYTSFFNWLAEEFKNRRNLGAGAGSPYPQVLPEVIQLLEDVSGDNFNDYVFSDWEDLSRSSKKKVFEDYCWTFQRFAPKRFDQALNRDIPPFQRWHELKQSKKKWNKKRSRAEKKIKENKKKIEKAKRQIKHYKRRLSDFERSEEYDREMIGLSHLSLQERLKKIASRDKPLSYYKDDFANVDYEEIASLSDSVLEELHSRVKKVSKNKSWREFKRKLEDILEEKI